MKLDRITFDPNIMGGKACIRGMRVTVGMIIRSLAGGMSKAEVLKDYPYLEPEDIDQAMSYASLMVDERILPRAG